MGTLTISGSGFAVLGASPPSDWPANITWPAGGSPNGTKSYTISDADWVQLLAWAAANYIAIPAIPPATPTAPQILLGFVQGWINALTDSVQHFHTQPATKPPPITIQ